jgi:hypothetical protein
VGMTCFGLSGQKTLFTASGTEIEIKDNDEWRIVEPQATEGDEINPFEMPVENKENLSFQELNLIDLIEKNMIQTEVEDFMAIQKINNIIVQSNLNISYYKTLKNKEEEKKAKAEVKRLEDEKSVLVKKYKESTENLMEIQDLKNKDKKTVAKAIQKYFSNDKLKEDLGANLQVVHNQIVRRHSNEEIILDDRNSYSLDVDCDIRFNGENPAGKGKFIQYSQQEYFKYTPAKIKPFYKEKDFLVARVNLENINGDYYLVLDLEFASKDAGKSYGEIKQGEELIISLIDGKKIILKSILYTKPILISNSGNTLYNCVFEIEKNARKTLKETYVDKVGIMYSSGFEEYTIYKVDMILNQLNCIDNAE